MLEKACWISGNGIEGCPIFQRNFVLKSEIKLAIFENMIFVL